MAAGPGGTKISVIIQRVWNFGWKFHPKSTVNAYRASECSRFDWLFILNTISLVGQPLFNRRAPLEGRTAAGTVCTHSSETAQSSVMLFPAVPGQAPL